MKKVLKSRKNGLKFGKKSENSGKLRTKIPEIPEEIPEKVEEL